MSEPQSYAPVSFTSITILDILQEDVLIDAPLRSYFFIDLGPEVQITGIVVFKAYYDIRNIFPHVVHIQLSDQPPDVPVLRILFVESRCQVAGIRLKTQFIHNNCFAVYRLYFIRISGNGDRKLFKGQPRPSPPHIDMP